MLEAAGGAVEVDVTTVDCKMGVESEVGSSVERCGSCSQEDVSSRPEASDARLEREGMVLMEARLDAEAEAEAEAGDSTGSAGVSLGGVPGSVWRPTGLSGRRKVPLLGAGSTPMESQMIL